MAGKKRADNASKSVSTGSNSKPKLNQRSILELFQKKTEPLAEPPTNVTLDSQVAVQSQVQLEPAKERRVESQLALDYEYTALLPREQAITEHSVSEQATTSASSPTTTELRSSPEIEIIEPLPKASGLRKEDPIVVDSSPVKAPKKTAPSKPLYSIFAPIRRREPSVTPTSPTKTRFYHREVPYPDSSSQHVKGPQTSFSAPPTLIPPRWHAPRPSSSSVSLSEVIRAPLEMEPIDTSARVLRVEISTSYSIRAAHLTNIPTEHMQSHPAIAHLAKSATTEADSSSDSHKLWTDKWHPSRADHVLGNEEQATFLRQWLSALEVHFDPAHEVNNADQSQDSGRVRQTKESAIIGKRGTKRRNIIRAVEKRPGRKRQRIDSDDDDDSWIVDSDDIEEDESQTVETLEEAEKPLETRPRSSHRFSGQNPVPNRAFDRLTNTILLSGPRSSGKTSAVYACAEELGWEVFEVYPGVGKRSGANLDNLVGEVGKNHLVRKRRFRNVRSGTNTKADGSLTSAFARGKEKEMLDDHREGSPPAARFIEELDDPPMEVHQSHETLPRQSLILLEEVDILFKDDTNFWGSLINLIRDCKRPVILTCNDTSLVPLAELPLQNVLNFRPCPTPVATSFLLALCCAEGYLLERDAISRFYEHPGSLDATGDLRQAIHNLQFWCPEKTQGGWTARCYQDSLETEDMLYWEWPDIGQSSDVSTLQAQATDSIGDREVYHADLISFADCYLLRNAVDTPKEMILNEELLNGADDVLSYRTLNTNGSSFRHNQFTYHDRDELIMSTAIGLSRGAHDADSWTCRLLKTTRALLRNRVRYDETIQEFGNNIIAGQSQILRRPIFDCDYLPWIRQMVAAEDEQEEILLKRDPVGIGRRTRNSQRFSRMIELTEKARFGLDATQYYKG